MLIDEIPLTDVASRTIFTTRKLIGDVLHGRDPRVMVVIGPCSIHDPAAARDYADRLAESAERFQDDLVVIMRVYFEKPRTTVGWKGLINDPHLDNSFDINAGLHVARGLLRDIADKGQTVVVVTHDPALAARADRRIHIVDGKIAEITGRRERGMVVRQEADQKLAEKEVLHLS